MQELHRAQEAEKNYKGNDLGKILDILDILRISFSFSQNDMELEAIISGEIGKIYYLRIKDREKARSYFTNVVRIGISMGIANLESVSWFTEAKSHLAKIHEEILEEEAADLNSNREKYKEDIDKLKSAKNKSHQEFMRLIYKDYKTSSSQLDIDEESLSQEKMKNYIRKTMLHYHCDKIGSLNLDVKMIFLASEIMKTLNEIYECYKG